MTPSDNSVLFALAELRTLEERRLTAERQAEARRQTEVAAAQERQQAEAREIEAHKQRLADAEIRLRLDAELRIRDADADRRMATLRAELNAIQVDRERMHETMVARTAEPTGSTSGTRALGWKIAFAGSSATAAGVFALWIGQPIPPVYPQATVAAAPTAEARPAESPALVTTTPIVAAPPPSVVDLAPRVRPRQTPPRPHVPAKQRDLLSELERCGDDPICAALDDP